ncbi:MAG: DoxX family protein [Candidatus Hydrogenedentes bacterium]|nr:DoxX family protein [Candidatus Hydrogenedentota bacterium]
MDSALNRYAPLPGRILLSAIFLMSGFGKITDFSGTTGYMASHGMPAAGFLLVMAILLELVGGLSVLTGFKARWGAVALIVFLIPATLIFHAFWSVEPDQVRMQTINFMKNLAIMGGLLQIVAYGAGAFSIDARKASAK